MRHERLAGARGADEQDVGFRELDFGIAHPVHVDALAVVVYRDRQLFLGGFLPDHILIQKFFHLEGLRQLVGAGRRLLGLVIFEDRVADCNALVANVCTGIVARGRNQLADYILTFVAKRTS